MREARERLLYEINRRHQRGEGIRAMARALNVSRKFVRGVLAELETRRSEGDDALARAQKPPRAPRASKLDRFVDTIEQLVTRYPDIRATRLHEELTAQGFDGGYTIVRDYLRSQRPRPPKRPAQVVRTGPGVQAQFDWSPYRLADGSKFYAFSCILAYSRRQYLHFTTDMRQPTIFRELRHSFELHGGIASQYVVDSMAGIVDRWQLGEPVLNARAADFAAYHGFEYHVAPRADGAYKGKVERPFRYLEESFFNAREFHTVAEANDKLAWWLEHRNDVRIHGTTKRAPLEMHDEERPFLRPLPEHPWDDREIAYRIVDDYGFVHFDGNRYLAKGLAVGRGVFVRAGEEDVEVLGPSAGVAARYPRAPRGEGRWVPVPVEDKRPARRPVAELVERFQAWGETAHRFALALRDRKRYAGAELGRILALQEHYSTEDILAAVEHAQRYAAHSAEAIERILKTKATPLTPAYRLSQAAREQIKKAMAGHPVSQRELAEYARYFASSSSPPGAPVENEHGEEQDPQDALGGTAQAQPEPEPEPG